MQACIDSPYVKQSFDWNEVAKDQTSQINLAHLTLVSVGYTIPLSKNKFPGAGVMSNAIK